MKIYIHNVCHEEELGMVCYEDMYMYTIYVMKIYIHTIEDIYTHNICYEEELEVVLPISSCRSS